MCVRETPKFLEIFMVKGWWFLKRTDWLQDVFMFMEVFLLGLSATVHWKELQRTMRRNMKLYAHWGEHFYVDDLLKSANSEYDTIKLIKNVRSRHNEGRFNLTNSIVTVKSRTQYLRTLEEMVSKTKTLAANYLMNKHWSSCGTKKLTLQDSGLPLRRTH